MAILINLFSYPEKAFIPSNIWIAGKDLMKPYCQIKKFFAAP